MSQQQRSSEALILNDDEAMQIWLEQRRCEREDEIKRLQQTTNVELAAQTVDHFLQSMFSSNDGNQNTNETSSISNSCSAPAVVVEIRALFESRPVTSLLQSNNFRRNLENIVRHSVGAIRTLQSSNASLYSHTTSSTTSLHNSPQATLSSSDITRGARVPQQSNSVNGVTPGENTVTTRSTTSVTPASNRLLLNGYQVPTAMINSTSNVARTNPTIRSASQITDPQNQDSFPTSVSALFNRNVNAENAYLMERRQEFVMEISELLHHRLVSSAMEGDFRHRLEATVLDHLQRSGETGEAALAALSNLPSTAHLRFQHDDMPAPWEHQSVDGRQSNSDGDNISILEARITTGNGEFGGNSAAISSVMAKQQVEMSRMKNEMKKMKEMMQLVFDMQSELQRTMKQELSAALNGQEIRAEAHSAARNSSAIQSGKCLICLDAKAEIVMYRCGHLCMCHKCSLTLPRHQARLTCPVCRAPVEDMVKIYDAGIQN